MTVSFLLKLLVSILASNFIFTSLGWRVKGECSEMWWELGRSERKSILGPEPLPYKSMPRPATGSKHSRDGNVPVKKIHFYLLHGLC